MSQVPRTSSAASMETPPPASAARNAAPIGIAGNQSSMRAASEPESSSCFSQIGSMISSLVSSIFSWISSLWNYVTGGECTASDAAAEPRPITPAQPPADVLIAKARNFFETRVLRNAYVTDQAKAASLILVNGQIVGACVATIQVSSDARSENPLLALCNQGMVRLEQILRQQTLNADSTVGIRMRILNPTSTLTNPTGGSRPVRGGGSYDVDFSASRDSGPSIHWGSMIDAAPVVQSMFSNIRCDSPNQQALQANILRFFTSPSDTQAGQNWTI